MGDVIGVALFALVCAGLDRLRGTDILPGFASKILYGLWIGGFLYWALALDQQYAAIYPALFALLWAGGASTGWGHPIGKALGGTNEVEPEWWQYHRVLVDSIPLALFVRGLMWAAPCMLLAYFDTRVAAVLSMGFCFMVAPYLANLTTDSVKDRWAPMEFIRGGLFGISIGWLAWV